jgi:hypothetical protein
VSHPLHVDVGVSRIRPLASQQDVEAGFAVGEDRGRRVDATRGAVVVLDEYGRHRRRHRVVGVEEHLDSAIAELGQECRAPVAERTPGKALSSMVLTAG